MNPSQPITNSVTLISCHIHYMFLGQKVTCVSIWHANHHDVLSFTIYTNKKFKTI